MELGEDLYFHYGAEEITDYQGPAELVAALKQKEEEVLLAAQLGNALLLENRQLKEQSDKIHEQYADKLEVRVGSELYPFIRRGELGNGLRDFGVVCGSNGYLGRELRRLKQRQAEQQTLSLLVAAGPAGEVTF